MTNQKSLTSLLTGAGVAMIALTAFALMFVIGNLNVAPKSGSVPIWQMVLASSCATLLVMSLLHSDLQVLYNRLTEAEDKAQKDARIDDLTGLGNRKFLFERLEATFDSPDASTYSALLFIDLDHFKRVNDTLGHRAGDELIKHIAERLRSVAHNAEIARLGGDEFALIINARNRKEISNICEKIVLAISQPISLDEGDCFISGSVGATFLEKNLNALELMRRADLAMYKAKVQATGFRIYDKSMSDEAQRRGALATALCSSLETGEGISSKCQPIVKPTGELWALEVLLRWENEEFGQVPPPEIISIAQEMHLINELSLHIVGEACQAALSFPDKLICLNVAAVQLLDQTFSKALEHTVSENQVKPAQIQLEIREQDFVERGRDIDTSLRYLCKAGFRIAVDDFGSSTSSLVQLKSLGVTTLKLDPSILEDSRVMGSIAVMRAKVGLAKSLGMTVICEGISDFADEVAAIQAGCDYLQGYRYGRPAQLASFLARQQSFCSQMSVV